MKHTIDTTVRVFEAVIRELFPQLGLLMPREYRFRGDNDSLGSIAGIYDERNGIIDIAKGPEHVVFKLPPGIRIIPFLGDMTDGSPKEVFTALNLDLQLQPVTGKYQLLAEYDLQYGVVITARNNYYAAFTFPPTPDASIHHYYYRKRGINHEP